MNKLTSNGFESYKTKKEWNAIEAACVVCGFEVTNYFSNPDYEEIELIFLASLKAFKERKLSIIKEVKVSFIGDADRSNFGDFYRSDNAYDCEYLKCFCATEYIKWLAEERIIKIPAELMVNLDDEGNVFWEVPPAFNPEEEISYEEFWAMADKLSKNLDKFFEYYKKMPLWTPRESLTILFGKEPESWDTEEMLKTADIMDRAIDAGVLSKIVKAGVGYFSPFEFLKWAANVGLEIPHQLEYKYESDGGQKKYYWVGSNTEETKTESTNKNHIINVDMKSDNLPEEPNCISTLPSQEALDQIKSDDQKIYKDMKNLDLWTLREGVAILASPSLYLFGHDDPGTQIVFLMEFWDKIDRRLLTRAVEGGTLKTMGTLKNDGFNERGDLGPDDHYLDLRVSPFEFLEFVKEKEWCEIPPELEFVKQTDESGKIQYSWADSTDVKIDPQPQMNIKSLSAKERQDYGRLKAEKNKLDATVKAAIEVGRFVESRVSGDKKILKREIFDFVYGIDKNIPDEQIKLIWRSLSPKIKKTAGRPKNIK